MRNSKACLHWVLCTGLAVVVLLSGCDRPSKPVVYPARRTLAITLEPITHIPRLTKFLDETNNTEEDFYEGDFGNFQGSISVITLSSNSSAWNIALVFHGMLKGFGSLQQTNPLHVTYPTGNQILVPQMGSITAWFPTKDEVESLKNPFAPQKAQ